MSRFFVTVIFGVLLFASCADSPARRVLNPAELSETPEMPGPYVIMDYKNNFTEESIPEWVSCYLEGGARAVEALDAYQGRYVFIARSEGNNFNALVQWNEWFSPELDFPRLAAVRIESRFSSGVYHPDHEYGAFFETLIRAASDALWTGANKEDDFWIFKKTDPASGSLQENGIYEFFILVTIRKTDFAPQFDEVFRNVRPNPPPTRDQIAAANRVKDRFYEGF